MRSSDQLVANTHVPETGLRELASGVDALYLSARAELPLRLPARLETAGPGRPSPSGRPSARSAVSSWSAETDSSSQRHSELLDYREEPRIDELGHSITREMNTVRGSGLDTIDRARISTSLVKFHGDTLPLAGASITVLGHLSPELKPGMCSVSYSPTRAPSHSIRSARQSGQTTSWSVVMTNCPCNWWSVEDRPLRVGVVACRRA